jgi:hypothetical protein
MPKEETMLKRIGACLLPLTALVAMALAAPGKATSNPEAPPASSAAAPEAGTRGLWCSPWKYQCDFCNPYFNVRTCYEQRTCVIGGRERRNYTTERC